LSFTRVPFGEAMQLPLLLTQSIIIVVILNVLVATSP
jgi:hypothetical protein